MDEKKALEFEKNYRSEQDDAIPPQSEDMKALELDSKTPFREAIKEPTDKDKLAKDLQQMGE